MIKNRYNYLTPSVQDTKGKEGHTYSNGTTIKTLQESQKDSFFPKNWPNGYHQNKISSGYTCQDIQWQN